MTQFNFSIQRKHIRAMLHLAAIKDIRYYLKGVNVVRDQRGTYIEATDGHVLGRLLIDGIKSDTPLSALLPSDSLAKLKGTKKQSEEFLNFSVEGNQVECVTADSTMKFSLCDGRFPDTDRVIPLVFKPEDNAPAHFNPDLLVRFVDVSADLYGSRQCPQLLQRGTQCVIVSFSLDDAFVGVMMPMRVEGAARVPDWCYTPRKVAEPESVTA